MTYKMAVVGRNGLGKFFIYDHNRLKKEEDDLKDAIIYFYPILTDADEQCALCGQLMGMSEFLQCTISKSVPTIFKLQNEKYCLKRIGQFTMGLEGSLTESDFHLNQQLAFLHQSFVMYCGSFLNISQQFVDDPDGFVCELQKIWKVLYPATCFYNNFISQVFHVLPTVHLPKSASDIYCQAADIIQASQRRPGVHVGAVLYKNKVLCTQMTPELTRKLLLVRPELPCIHVETGFQIPQSIHLITVYLTKEEMKSIDKTFKPSIRHSKAAKFIWQDHTKCKIRVPSRNNSDSHISKDRTEMETIPEQQTLKFLQRDLPPDTENVTTHRRLSWTTHLDYTESLELESQKPAENRKETIETISDLEENGNGNNINKSEQYSHKLSERKKSSISVSEEHIVKSKDSVMYSENQKKGTQLNVDAMVHCNENDLSSDTHEQLLNENVPNDSNQILRFDIGFDETNESQPLIIENLLSKDNSSGDSCAESTVLVKQRQSSMSPDRNDDVKVDCLHECTCCKNDVKRTLVAGDIESTNSANNHTVICDASTEKNQDSVKQLDNSVKDGHGLNDSRKGCKNFEDENSLSSSMSEEVSANIKIDEILSQNANKDKIEGTSVQLGQDYEMSDESSIGDDSISDIASLSTTSRRKERFDFQSSAEESATEYNLFAKRNSFETFSKKFEIREHEEPSSMSSLDSSLQSTLKSSGTFSLQSSSGHSAVKNHDFEGYWEPQQDDLYEMTLYMQGQSSSQACDISLILLVDNSIKEDDSTIHSLWKDALPQLADLEFYVKECVDQQLDEGFMESSSFLKYDTFLHRIEGNETEVPVNEDFQKLAAEIHKDYQENCYLTNVALTNHLCSCNSSRDQTNEVFIHVDGQSTNR